MSPLFRRLRCPRTRQVPATMPADADLPDTVRPLRRDAERNRQRILKAASEVFNERGLEVSLDEIARYAGVGVGTVYRRFRTKEELVEALFVDRIDSIAAIAEKALEASDPWSGLVSFMEQMAEMLARRPRPAADADVRHLRPGPGGVRAAAERAAGAAAGRAGPGGRAAPGRPRSRPTYRSSSSCSPRRPCSPGRSAPRSGGGTSASFSTACAAAGRRHPAARTGAPPEEMEKTMRQARHGTAEDERDLHLQVHVQGVNESMK